MEKTEKGISVSIILPMYNVARYLDSCIASLQSQTLKNVEMIFVDDCSTDKSKEIVQRYAFADDRIRLIENKTNCGAGASRNRGIVVAMGEYVAFMDPDDTINSEFYERLYMAAKDGPYDIVIGERLDVVRRANGEVRTADPARGNGIMKECGEGLPLYASFIHGHQAAIYRLDMVRANGARYSETSFGECGMFILTACCATKRFCFVSGAHYFYLQHENSQAHSRSRSKYDSELKAIFEQIHYATERLQSDRGYVPYLKRKFNFLLWRAKELVRQEPSKGYLESYMRSIKGEMEKLPNKEVLRKNNEQFGLLLDGRIKWLIFLIRYERQMNFIRRIVSGVRRRVCRVFPQRPVDIRYDFSNREICYLQGDRGAVYFSKEFVERGGAFAKNYLEYFRVGGENFNNNLPIGSNQYEEHCALSKKGELCWKYVRRLGHISKSTIFLDGDGCLCMRGEIIGADGPVVTRHYILLPQPARRIIDGITLREYLLTKGQDVDELFGELVQFLDFIFLKYGQEDGSIRGIAFDARPCNCIVKEQHQYELFDFEYEYRGRMERGFLVYLATLDVEKTVRAQVYFRLCEHYRLIPDREGWDKKIVQGWIEIISDKCESRYLIS